MLFQQGQETLYGIRSKSVILADISRKSTYTYNGKWTNTSEAIVQAVAEATRAPIQAMAVARAERTQNVGPRLGRAMMKHPTFNWEAEDKYNELKNSRPEVNNIFKSYSMPQAE